ncbi:Acetyltransferase, GNAT family [Priestia megaterium WSH-002]|uniref:Acetyltransferase, GNAT family n=1 Tax=Priestia megaterium (strain WSH-002) TaxID=1006007 RepID=A0A8D4BKR8_PRIMW|nr:Acetyltransferase, GNAT family [Priestia megaterium WSH-002]
MKLHRIIATCQPENTSSYRVMEKIGMRREGYFKKMYSN